jgi:hypothetical protein
MTVRNLPRLEQRRAFCFSRPSLHLAVHGLDRHLTLAADRLEEVSRVGVIAESPELVIIEAGRHSERVTPNCRPPSPPVNFVKKPSMISVGCGRFRVNNDYANPNGFRVCNQLREAARHLH